MARTDKRKSRTRKKGRRRTAPSVRRNSSRWTTPILVLLVLSVGASFLRAWEFAEPSPGIDFYQFWLAGKEVVSPGPNRMYRVEGHAAIGVEAVERAAEAEPGSRLRQAADVWGADLLLSGSPLLYTFFGLSFSGDYDSDLRRYLLLTLVGGALSCLVLCNLLGYSRNRSLLAVVLVLIAYEPFYSDMSVANVNRVQLAFLTLFLWIQSRAPSLVRDLSGGLLLGVLVFFKPNLIAAVGAVGFCWLTDRNFRTLRDQLIGSAVLAILVAGVTVVLFEDIGVWQNWYYYGSGMSYGGVPVSLGNLAPAMIIYELFGGQIALRLTAMFAATTVAALWLTRPRRPGSGRSSLRNGSLVDDRGRVDRTAVAFAAGCLVYLLGAMLAWIHYYTFALPAILIAWRPLPAGSVRLWQRGLALIALLPLAKSVPNKDLILSYPKASAVAFGAAALILFGLLIRELHSSKDSAAGA